MKKNKLLKIISICLVCICAGVCGLFCGNIINGKYFTINKFDSINIGDLKDDITQIDYASMLPSELSATDVYLVAMHILNTKDSYTLKGFGNVETSVGVKQTTYTHRQKNGDLYYYEFATHSSMIQLAKRTSYKVGEDLVFQVGEPTDSSLKTLGYKDKYETVTYNDYSNGIGREPTSNETYLVSSKTLLDVSSYKEENGLYYYTLNLNPELAGINYRKEIAYVSGVDVNTIEFISINISFVVDKNFNLISHTTTDNYTMKYAGIKVSVNGNYSINF